MASGSRSRKSTTNGGKNESSGSGEPSGLRRSTRETPSKNKNNNNKSSSCTFKKRLDARSYREMFKPLKKAIKVPDSSKKARPENCDDSDGSEDEEEGQEEGNVGEELKEDCINDVNDDTRVLDADAGEELKEDCTDDVNGDTKVSDAAGAGNKDARIEKPSESEDGKSLQVSVSGDMPSSSPGTEIKKSEAEDLEVDRSGMEASHDREKPLAKNRLSDDGNGVRCDLKGTTSEAPPASERTLMYIEDALPSVSSRCKMSLLTEQCTECLRKRRLDYNSPKQELCCCFSNSMSDIDMISVSKCQERRKGSNVKLGTLSGGCLSGADSFYLNSMNKLWEYHNKGHNAVLLGEQDRIVKAVHLVSSLLPSFYQPFLIITPYESLSFWEAEFLRIAASVNVVVYRGSANAREIIRSSEFYGEDSI